MRKIQYLDGLRGLAAFIVVFHHFILAFYPALFFGGNLKNHLSLGTESLISGSPLNIFYGGNFMVAIFFVMSGFVLSHKFFIKKDYEILTQGAVKRYVRLVIPVAFSIFAAYLLMEFSLFYNGQAAVASGSNWLGSFWTFTPSVIDAASQTTVGVFFANSFNYNVTLWTVAFEFFGAFLLFGFMALFGNIKNRYWAYILAIILFAQTYYLAFIFGMLLSDMMVNKNIVIRQINKRKIILPALLAAGLFLGSYPSGRGVDGTIYASMEKSYLADSAVLYHIIGAFLVMLVLLNSKKMQKAFSFKPLLFLGEISFTMYLLHFIMLGSFSSYIFLLLEKRMLYGQAFLLTFLISIAFLIPLSYLMYLYIDKKSVHLSRIVYMKIFKKT